MDMLHRWHQQTQHRRNSEDRNDRAQDRNQDSQASMAVCCCYLYQIFIYIYIYMKRSNFLCVYRTMANVYLCVSSVLYASLYFLVCVSKPCAERGCHAFLSRRLSYFPIKITDKVYSCTGTNIIEEFTHHNQ